jgi:predicted DCC family thiol-disulfide oxidoreductase YuxK
LFYDGDCALCNRCVRYVLRHEKEPELFFASLQSDFARQVLGKYNYDFGSLSTLVLVSNGQAFYKSDAALNLSRFLKAPYRWALALKLCPRILRDAVYDLVSRNRKKWFRREFCYVPDMYTRKRFLDQSK